MRARPHSAHPRSRALTSTVTPFPRPPWLVCVHKQKLEGILKAAQKTGDKAPAAAAPAPAAPAAAAPAGPGLKSDALFAQMKTGISADVVKKAKSIFQFNITKDGKTAATWTVDAKNGAGDVYQGPIKSGKATCVITVSDDDFLAMADGKLQATKAYMSGAVKIKGNLMAAQASIEFCYYASV